MRQRFACSRGHEWEDAGSSPLCPVCGAPGQMLSPGGDDTAKIMVRSTSGATLCEPLSRLASPSDDSLAEQAPTLAPGEVPLPNRKDPTAVRGYEILGILGHGGMGVVYKARHSERGDVVAIKMTRAGSHTTPEELTRFRTEAEAGTRLRHPHIVQVYEVGEQDGCPYFVREFVDGGTLHQRLAGIPQPSRKAARFVELLARAMHYAHEQGIVHRDLKPSNILLAPSSSAHALRLGPEESPRCLPKITDFGLAKCLVDLGRAEDTPAQAPPTLSGAVLGTPSYMAPEQARGHSKDIEPVADVYSLGAILYEMLTGRPPFKAPTPLETLRQVLANEPVPPSRLQPNVKRELDAICLKCLEKEPDKRYASALELAGDLQHFLKGEPITARPPTELDRVVRWCRRNPVVAGLSVAVFLLVLAVAIGSSIAAIRIAAARDRADRHATQAEQAEHDAERERTRAEENAQQSRQRLVRISVQNGARLMDQGDLVGALHWFTEALQLDQGDLQAEERHRVRLAAVLRQCPKLVHIWFYDDPASYAAFSPDGRLVATAGHDRTARVWDARTGAAVSGVMRHGDVINHVAFSPDGRFVVTGGEDWTARIWDAHTGQPITEPLRHQAPVWYTAFSPNGRLLLTASWDKTARLWDAATGRELHTLRLEGDLWCAAFSPDSRLLATTNGSSANVWETATGQRLPLSLQHARNVFHVAFDATGARLATASEDGTARVWETATGRPVTLPLEHPSPVSFIAFSPDGRQLAVAGSVTARIWDAAAGQPVTPLLVHTEAVWEATFSPDGRTLVTASGDGVHLWDVETGRRAAPPLRHGGLVNHAIFSADGRYVLSSGGHTVQLWDRAVGPPLRLALPHAADVQQAVFSPCGRQIATASADGTVQIWDAETGRPQASPPRQQHAVRSLAFSPDGRYLATVSDRQAQVWDTAMGRPPGWVAQHDGRINRVEFSNDSRHLLTASADHTARLWDVATGRMLCLPLAHRQEVLDARFSADGTRVLTAGFDRAVRVWDVATGQLAGQPFSHKASVRSAVFSPDGKQVATACVDGVAQLWDIATGQPAAPPFKHNAPLCCVAFSRDSRYLVSAGEDRTARIWDVAAGQPLTPPLRHNGTVTQAAFSPDGTRLLTAAADGTAQLWNVATGQPLMPLLRHGGAVVSAAFSPDGRAILTAGGHTVNVWEPDLVADSRPVEDLRQLVQALDQHQIDAAGGLVPLDVRVAREVWTRLRAKYPDSFTGSSNDMIRWHRREAAACVHQRKWAEALGHLNPLLDAGAATWPERVTRLQAYAALGRWRDLRISHKVIWPHGQ